MTELDRLRAVAEDLSRSEWCVGLGAALLEIANAIEREVYDISGYESDVLGWVEKNGGLDAVKERTMPEDMSWPFYEDGEPVRIGGEVEVHPGCSFEVDTIAFEYGGFVLNAMRYRDGERVKRPAKVLDADGAEIEVGDDLYSIEGCLKLHVGVIDTRNGKIATAEMYALDKWADPAMYTHRAPVLAADGKPIREGERVWNTEINQFGTVEEIFESELCGQLVRFAYRGGGYGAYEPSKLTHERPAPPDSWERLEKDANKAVCLYFGVNTKACSECAHNSWECSFDKDCDLVRRAKALAGRDE